MQQNDARFLELLQRWHSGDFTRADEQELHALAASDDFRREAMEGFMSMPEAAHRERLAALRMRLRQRGGGGRLLALPQVLTAAAVLVLLIAAMLFFPKWNARDAAPVAQNEAMPSGQSPVYKFDSAAPYSESQYMAGSQPAVKAAPSAAGPSQRGADRQSPSPQGAADDVVAAEEAEFIAADDVQADNAAASLQAPGAAPVRMQPLDKMASEPAKDRAVEAVSSRPEQSANAKKSKAPNRPADSTWHETDLKPDMDAERKAARDEETGESEPEGGWEAFSEYLRQNARLTPEARDHNASGKVKLQFVLNANSQPQGFIVLRSVGYGCDQEAIRLVQSWEWVRGLNPVVTVEVPFVR